MNHAPYRHFLIVAAVLATMVGAALWHNLPLTYLAAINLLTLGFYGRDKHCAVKNKYRIPESTLHMLAVAGGTFGAQLGQIIFRHKTRKIKFKIIFVMIVLIHAGLILLWYRLTIA